MINSDRQREHATQKKTIEDFEAQKARLEERLESLIQQSARLAELHASEDAANEEKVRRLEAERVKLVKEIHTRDERLQEAQKNNDELHSQLLAPLRGSGMPGGITVDETQSVSAPARGSADTELVQKNEELKQQLEAAQKREAEAATRVSKVREECGQLEQQLQVSWRKLIKSVKLR